MELSDLSVIPKSSTLRGKHLDVIVTGSIAAVESVRFVRALRRLGAEITVYLSDGGAQFITPIALSWASTRSVVTGFSGEATHLATHDGCVIAPASANFIADVLHGKASTPSTALVASYFGQRRPVFYLPAMHESLFRSPHIKTNLARFSENATELP